MTFDHGSRCLDGPEATDRSGVRGWRRSASRFRAAAGIGVMCLSFVLLIPPFGGPDEADHHTRLQGVASGMVIGAPAEPVSPELTPLQVPWVRQTTRSVRVPADRSAAPAGCVPQSSVVLSVCRLGQRDRLEVTPVGTYEPFPYLLPAAVARLSHRPAGADRWERLGSLALPLGLLVSAAVLASVSNLLLGGFLLAASPGLLLVTAGLGGSGLESAAALALVTALLTPAVAPSRTRSAFFLAAVAAPCLVLARSLGPLWLLAILLACAPMALPWLRRVPTRSLVPAGGVILVALIGQRIWEAKYGPSIPQVGIPPSIESLTAGTKRMPHILRETVGADGYFAWLAPWPIAGTWLAALLALVLGAVRGGSRHSRVHLVIVTMAVLVSAPVFFATVIRYTGFKVQARHMFPLFVVIPMLAAAYVARQRHAPVGFGSLPVIAGVIDASISVSLARHYSSTGYTPPLGWIAVGGAAVVGAALVTSAAWRTTPTRDTIQGSPAGWDTGVEPV